MADLDTSTKEKHVQPIYQAVLVQTSEYAPYFRRILILHMPFSSILLSHNVSMSMSYQWPFSQKAALPMCTHACAFESILSDYWCLEPMRLVTRHLPRSTTEVGDTWKLGRVRLAAAANQIWWTVLPPSLLENLIVCRLVASSDGRGHHPFSRHSVHIHWCKFAMHVAAASTYLLTQEQEPLLLPLVLYSRLIM